MPSTLGIVGSHVSQLDEWLRAHVVAFDERRSSPLVNLGTLGAAGDAVATGTRRLVNTGSETFVWLPGGSAVITGDILTVPDAANLRITGDLYIELDLAADDWTPSTGMCLAGKDHTTTGRGYALTLSPTGRINLHWSPLGTDASAVFRQSTASVPFADLQRGRLGAFLDVDNGAGGHTVTFYSSPDQSTPMTQLGNPVVTAGTTSIFATTQPFAVGYCRSGSINFAGSVYRCIVKDGIDGATVLNLDASALTDEGATSWLTTTGQTVIITRSTGATYKTTVVLPGSAKRLFNGTTDLLSVANNDALDFGTADSFSAWMLIRQWATPVSSARLLGKQNAVTTAGYSLNQSTTTHSYTFYVSDGMASPFDLSDASTSGALRLIGGTRSVASDNLAAYLDATAAASPSTDTTTATLANSLALRVGARPDGIGFQHFELYAWGIYPGALTAAQWAALRDALLVPERANP